MKGLSDLKDGLLVLDKVDVAHFKTFRLLVDAGYTLIFSDDDQFAFAQKQGLASVPWHAHDGADLITRIESEVIRLCDRIRQIESGMLSPDRMAVPDTFVEAIRRQMLAIERLHAFHDRSRLRGILVERGEASVHQAVLEAGYSLGMPIVRLASPVALGEDPCAVSTDGVGRREIHCVAGKHRLNGLLAKKIPAEQIRVTGVPAWDSLVTLAREVSPEDARRRLCLDPRRPVVLFCGAYPGHSSLSFERAVRWSRETYLATVEACRAISPDLQLIVLPDPLESDDRSISAEQMSQADDLFRAWSARHGYLVSLVARGEKTDALMSCDVAIAPSGSILASELTLLERPIVVLPFTEDPTENPLDEAACTKQAFDWRRAIRQAIAEPSHRLELVERARLVARDLSCSLDGRAAERTYETILEIMEKSRLRRVNATLSLQGRKGLRILLVTDASKDRSTFSLVDRLFALEEELERNGHQVEIVRLVASEGNTIAQIESESDSLEARLSYRMHLPSSARDASTAQQIKEEASHFLREHRFDVVHLHVWSSAYPQFLEAAHDSGAVLCYSPHDFRAICDQGELWNPLGVICSGPETVDKCVHCAQHRLGLVEDDLPATFYRLAERRIHAHRAIAKFDHVFHPSEFHLQRFLGSGATCLSRSVVPKGSEVISIHPRRRSNGDRLIIRCFSPIGRGHGVDTVVRAFRQASPLPAALYLHGEIKEPWYFEQLLSRLEAKDAIFHEPIRDQAHFLELLDRTDLILDHHEGASLPESIRRLGGSGIPLLLPDTGDRTESLPESAPVTFYRSMDVADFATALRDWVSRGERHLQQPCTPVEVWTFANEAREYECQYMELLERSGRFNIPVNIVLVAPPSCPEGLLHRELVDDLAEGFRSQGISCQIQRNKVARGAINLFVGFERIEASQGIEGVRRIAVCFDPVPTDAGVFRRLATSDEVWTLSTSDAERLQREGVVARVIPIAPSVRVGEIPRGQDLDVVFEGVPNERQRHLLSSLESFCEVTRFHGADDVTRREIYQRGKIALLLSSEKGRDIDVAKALYLLRHGVFTIGEKADHERFASYWVESSEKELANTVYRYLSKPVERQQHLQAVRQRLEDVPTEKIWASWLGEMVVRVRKSSDLIVDEPAHFSPKRTTREILRSRENRSPVGPF